MDNVICIQCGLAAGETDLAGCTRDTETGHDFRSLESNPFGNWSFEAIYARMQRAAIKAASASATAAHAASCPQDGPGSYFHRLYAQKARKRLALANALGLELARRARMDEIPEEERFDRSEQYLARKRAREARKLASS